jgi:hypothetical protein
MKIKDLSEILKNNAEAEMHIMLPSGEFVPSHFHVTEVGEIRKSFIDCGGTIRSQNICSLQVWTAKDVDHRLLSGKLVKIIDIANAAFEIEDLDVVIEYGPDVAAQYYLSNVEQTPKGPLLVLAGKQTDCLAPDKCGVSGCC